MGDFDLEKLSNIAIQFRIPFGLDVLNSIHEGDSGQPYIVVINGIPTELRFERIYDFRYKDEGVEIAPFSRIKQDRSGILSTHKITVFFNTEILSSIDIEKDMISFSHDIFLNRAIDYVNKFLLLYREVTEQFWIRPIQRIEIFGFYFFMFDINGNSVTRNIIISSNKRIEMNGGREFNIEKNQDLMLREMLLTDYFNFRNEIILNTIDNFYLGNYNIALMQSLIRFENFVYTNLLKKLSKTQIKKLTKKECGCIAGINEICVKGFLKLFNVDFENTEEYKNLKEFAIKYRNKIAHGEIIENIGKETAQRGIESVGLAEKYLIDNIFTDINFVEIIV